MTTDGQKEQLRLQNVLDEVRAEIRRAEAKHGPEAMTSYAHDVGKRLGILGEEFGEVCRATTYDNRDDANLRAELVQVAAMATAWVYALDTLKIEARRVLSRGANELRDTLKSVIPLQLAMTCTNCNRVDGPNHRCGD